MTIQDLPKRLQVEGVRITVPGEIVNIHFDEARMIEIEPMALAYLERKAKQTKEGA